MDFMTDDQIDALLRRQVQRLDTAFNDFVALALEQPKKLYYHQLEMNVALRTQSQCRATAHTIKQWQRLDSPPAQQPVKS